MSATAETICLVVSLVSSAVIGPVFHLLGIWYDLCYTIIALLPVLAGSMFLSYRFEKKSASFNEIIEAKYAGHIADFLSICLLGLAILSVAFEGCAYVPQGMHDGNIEDDQFVLPRGDGYIYKCDISFEEFQEIEQEVYGGK